VKIHTRIKFLFAFPASEEVDYLLPGDPVLVGGLYVGDFVELVRTSTGTAVLGLSRVVDVASLHVQDMRRVYADGYLSVN